MTFGISGLMPSDTKACSTWLSIGSLRPAIDATRDELPATAMPTLPAPIVPRVVSTPVTLAVGVAREAGDLAVLDDVDAALVGGMRIAHTTASCRAVPPRGCSSPPWIGKRALSKLRNGTSFFTPAWSSSSASMPLMRMALPRRA